MGFLPWISFQAQQQKTPYKIIAHSNSQSMSWMQRYKETYLVYPSGNRAHAQGYYLVTHHSIKAQ